MISDNATKLWLAVGSIITSLISLFSLLASLRNHGKLKAVEEQVNGITHASIQRADTAGQAIGFEAGRQMEIHESEVRNSPRKPPRPNPRDTSKDVYEDGK
jgi:hypothetical protein